MDVLPKTAACTQSLHHGHPRNRTEHVRTNSSPRFLRNGGKDNESHHRFGRHHGHGHRRGEVVEIPAGHILTVVKTAPEGTESTGAVSSGFARIVRIGRHGNPGGHGRSYGRHGSPESQEGHRGHGRHGSHAHGGFRGGHRRGEISTGGETAGEAEKMTAGRISEGGAGGWKSHGERHGSNGGRGMRHVTNGVNAPVDERNVDGGDVSIKEA